MINSLQGRLLGRNKFWTCFPSLCRKKKIPFYIEHARATVFFKFRSDKSLMNINNSYRIQAKTTIDQFKLQFRIELNRGNSKLCCTVQQIISRDGKSFPSHCTIFTDMHELLLLCDARSASGEIINEVWCRHQFLSIYRQ